MEVRRKKREEWGGGSRNKEEGWWKTDHTELLLRLEILSEDSAPKERRARWRRWRSVRWAKGVVVRYGKRDGNPRLITIASTKAGSYRSQWNRKITPLQINRDSRGCYRSSAEKCQPFSRFVDWHMVCSIPTQPPVACWLHEAGQDRPTNTRIDTSKDTQTYLMLSVG